MAVKKVKEETTFCDNGWPRCPRCHDEQLTGELFEADYHKSLYEPPMRHRWNCSACKWSGYLKPQKK